MASSGAAMNDDEDKRGLHLVTEPIKQPVEEAPAPSEEAPNNVVSVTFGPKTELRPKYAEQCYHRQFVADSTSRTLSCKACGKLCDTFDILMLYVRDDAHWKYAREQHRKLNAEISALKKEEERIKNRTKNARRKDANVAVKAERQRLRSTAIRTIDNAREIQKLAARILRAAGADLAELREPTSVTPRNHLWPSSTRARLVSRTGHVCWVGERQELAEMPTYTCEECGGVFETGSEGQNIEESD